MPVDLTPEEVQRYEADYTAGRLSGPKSAAWERIRAQYIKPPETPVASPPEGQPGSQDSRASSPWYQRVYEQYVAEPVQREIIDPALKIGTDIGTRAYERSAFGKRPWYDEPGMGLGQYVPTKEQARTALEVGVPMLVAGAMAPYGRPAAIPVATQMSRSALWNLAQQLLPPAYRAAVTGAAAGASAEVANKLIDPEHHVDPVSHGLMTGAGEMLGGIAGNVYNRGARSLSNKIVEHFGDTPQGATVRETVEGLGGEAALGTTTRSPFLTTTSSFLEHVPGGKRLRDIRTKGQQLVDDALQQYNARFPGDEVARATPGMITRPTERSMLDLEAPLRPVLPGRRQSTLDAEARLRPHLVMGTQQDLEQVPREVARRIPEAIARQQELTDSAFQNLREVVNNSPVDARGLKSYLQATTIPAGTQDPSLFHQLEDLKSTLQMLPDTTTVESAFEIQGRLLRLIRESHEVVDEAQAQMRRGLPVAPQVSIVQNKLLPELGNTLKYTNKMLEGRTVNLQSIKDEARTILAGYEQGTQVGQGMMEGTGRTGRVPTPEDPHILVARNLLEKPNFVPFDEAQQILSDFNALKRHPGPNIGNQAADAGGRLRDLLWGNAQKNLEGEIFKTTRTLDPGIERVFRNAQELYERGARLYNSPLMMDLSKASVDDILTTIVKNERPEDLKALRYVLGEDLFDRVGQMWLKRAENASMNTVTKQVSPVAVQQQLQELTPIAEAELFPHGQVARLKMQIDRAAAMEQALTTNEPLVYRALKGQMSRADAEQVGEIRLTQLLEKHRDPVTGALDFDAALKEIQPFNTTDMAQELWPVAQMRQIETSLSQASALQRGLTTNDELALKELQRQAGPYWDTAGEVRLSNIFRKNTDAQGNLHVGQTLNDIHALRGPAEAVLYGTKLDPLKTALRKADAMEQVFGVLDQPEMITKYRQVVNDPRLWSSVQHDVLAPGFKMLPRLPEMPGPSMVDGRALVDHINTLRQNPAVAKALFPNGQVLDELHHLGETAMMLSKRAHDLPYDARHFAPVVSFNPDGTPTILGSKIAGAGAAVLGGISQANRFMSWAITRPAIIRLLTQGMHTPVSTPQASRVFGALVGALESEGYSLEMSNPPPLPKVGD